MGLNEMNATVNSLVSVEASGFSFDHGNKTSSSPSSDSIHDMDVKSNYSPPNINVISLDPTWNKKQCHFCNQENSVASCNHCEGHLCFGCVSNHKCVYNQQQTTLSTNADNSMEFLQNVSSFEKMKADEMQNKLKEFEQCSSKVQEQLTVDGIKIRESIKILVNKIIDKRFEIIDSLENGGLENNLNVEDFLCKVPSTIKKISQSAEKLEMLRQRASKGDITILKDAIESHHNSTIEAYNETVFHAYIMSIISGFTYIPPMFASTFSSNNSNNDNNNFLSTDLVLRKALPAPISRPVVNNTFNSGLYSPIFYMANFPRPNVMSTDLAAGILAGGCAATSPTVTRFPFDHFPMPTNNVDMGAPLPSPNPAEFICPPNFSSIPMFNNDQAASFNIQKPIGGQNQNHPQFFVWPNTNHNSDFNKRQNLNQTSSTNPESNSNSTTIHNSTTSPNNNNYPPKSQIKRQKMIYHCKFGEFGHLKGQFTEPSGVAVNAQNEIIVADTNNHRIQVFRRDGTFSFQFGECGKGEGQLLYPNRVAVIPGSGEIVVTERSPTHQVQIFESNGTFIRKFGANILQHPRGVCADNQRRIVVVECKVMRIVIFDYFGRVLHKFGCSQHLEFPNGVVVNDKKEIFISDNRAHCVMVFNYEGEFLRQIGGEGLTNFPIGVGINSAGQITVCDNHNNFNLSVFSQDGQMIDALESKVKHAQCFDVALMGDGSVVLASKDYRIYIYKYLCLKN